MSSTVPDIAPDPNTYNVYGYTPRRAENLAALILFAIAWAMHTGLGVYHRQYWFGTSMFIATGLETAGYIARYLSSYNPDIVNDFLVQIICLTLGPAFFMAGMYFLLAETVIIWGIDHSRLKPWAYSQLFISLDVVSIILQAVGGGMAATALVNGTEVGTGTHIMVAGLAFQVFGTTIFFLACLDFFWHVYTWKSQTQEAARPSYIPNLDANFDQLDTFHSSALAGPEKFAKIRESKQTKIFVIGALAAVVFVYIRSIYRVVELSIGWTGYLMAEEGYFLVLDTLMVFIATWIMWVLYPAWCYGRISVSNEHKTLVSQKSELGELQI
ncbi:RTA1 like protein-domain-containing protein [Lipomyces arxii]|uniref:RTA1 like protein-domain-containing protein n=1 Tax=Lipomyces arxii TaxID=56418 RepID=UPI0034CD9CEC